MKSQKLLRVQLCIIFYYLPDRNIEQYLRRLMRWKSIAAVSLSVTKWSRIIYLITFAVNRYRNLLYVSIIKPNDQMDNSIILSRVSTLKRDIYKAILSVCLSACLWVSECVVS